MSRAGLLRRLNGIWPLLPPLLLLGRAVLPPLDPGTGAPEVAGPGILCLPAQLATGPDPLAGWMGWPAEAGKEVADLQLQIEKKIVPEKSPSRQLELRGRLNEDGGTVYCIYDATAARWHRLEPGHADAEGGLALVPGRRDRLLLHDHHSDRIYEVGEDPLRLLPLAEGGSHNR